MKVLLVAGQLIGGGSEKQLAVFLENLEDGVETSCYVLNTGGVWTKRVRRSCGEFHVATSRSRISRVLEFERIVRRLRPDLVHCWHTYPFIYPLFSRFIHRVPIIVNLRGELTVDSDTGRQTALGVYRWLAHVDAVISNSRHVLEELETRGFSNSRYYVPNGIELQPEPPGPSADGAVRVAGVGSLKPLKNWGQLIRVCGQLVRDGRPVTLTIFGEGPERPELESLCRSWDLPPREVLPGFRPDLAASLATQDILVHCSLSEGQPNAILEGLSAGLPVVASDLEASRELNVDGDVIQLYPVEDDDACRERLDSLVQDPSRRAALGRLAREFVRANFDPPSMAAKYVEIYRAVLASRL